MIDARYGALTLQAQAIWRQLQNAVNELLAGFRNDAPAAEAIRRQAHDLLDLHCDLTVEGITGIRLASSGSSASFERRRGRTCARLAAVPAQLICSACIHNPARTLGRGRSLELSTYSKPLKSDDETDLLASLLARADKLADRRASSAMKSAVQLKTKGPHKPASRRRP